MFRHLFILTLTAMVSPSRTCRSPLSDVDITDPSLIRPKIVVRKLVNYLGSLSQKFEASFFDSNGNAVELKNGDVAANGVSMSLTTSLLTAAPGYVLNTASLLQVALDSTYTFVTTLADGQQINSVITMQEKNLFDFIAPTRHPKATDLLITWKEGDARYRIILSLLAHIARDSTDRFENETINLPDPASEQFAIPASFFTSSDSIFRVDMTLTTKSTGNVNSQFRSGGEITSRFSIERRVLID
jgi:hypothetical protein